MSLPLNDFLTFLNERQRDPRLNEILFPIKKKSEAAALIQRHEKAKNKGTERQEEREREGERERRVGERRGEGGEGNRAMNASFKLYAAHSQLESPG